MPEKLLYNILSNAVKFTYYGKIKLYICWEMLPGNKVNLLFEVTDTGVGIKKEDIPKLFSQVGTTNSMAKGIGLGFALSRELARHMGGDITVKSEYGSGSIFTINIEQDIVK